MVYDANFFSYNFFSEKNLLILPYESSFLYFFFDFITFFYFSIEIVCVVGVLFNFFLSVFLFFCFDFVENLAFHVYNYVGPIEQTHRLILGNLRRYLLDEFSFLFYHSKFKFFHAQRHDNLSYLFKFFFLEPLFGYKLLVFYFFFRNFSFFF